MTRVLLLDLDGTLSDNGPGIDASYLEVAARFGLPRLTPAQLRRLVGPPLQDCLLAIGVPPERLDEAVAAYRERYDRVGWRENTAYPGVVDALAALCAQGLVLALATSKPAVFAERIADLLGFAPHLSAVGGASLDGTRRGKEAVARHALAQLGADPVDVLALVGDRHHDVEGARALGVTAVGVRWGYAEPGELEGAGADLVLDAPEQLADLPALLPR